MANNVTVDNNQKPAYKAETLEQASGEHRQVVHVAIAGTINSGRKIVTVAGTAETLIGVTTACRTVDITAETDNTGVIVVGGSAVVASQSTRTGTPLNAGDSYSIQIDDLQKVYIDSTVSGDGVTFTYNY